jgi:hypothetical protein
MMRLSDIAGYTGVTVLAAGAVAVVGLALWACFSLHWIFGAVMTSLVLGCGLLWVAELLQDEGY